MILPLEDGVGSAVRRGANGSPGSFELFDKTKNMVDVESSNEIMKRESGDRKAKDF